MRQKYTIFRDDANGQLKIREFAVTEIAPKNVMVSVLEKSKFSLLCEETYSSESVRHAIGRGKQALVACLRTRHIFPVAPFAAQIAASVTSLYSASGERSVELFFDDADLVAAPSGEAA